MPYKTPYTIILLFISGLGFSQSAKVLIAKGTRLPPDSTALVASIGNFLNQYSRPNKDNPFIQAGHLIETSAILDELKGMENAETGKPGFYQCYLTNVSPVDSTSCLIQLSYLAADGGSPVLKAAFRLVAQKTGDAYLFSSPLKRNTVTWKVTRSGDFRIYRNGPGKVGLLDRYIKKAKEFDGKLKAPRYNTEIYYADSFDDLMNALGENYKLEYNGLQNINQSWYEERHSLYLIGAAPNNLPAFDLHDLWHSRLHHVVSTDIINRPIDEACAYLYGGSWGIYTWPDILEKFKTLMGSDHDWLKVFNEHRRFGEAKTPLYTDYVINALIAQNIEKKQGFPKVIAFLSCGKKQPDNANYFKALEQITGITKANFNERVEQLISGGK